MSGTVDPATLVDAPLGDLMAEAARLRDSAHGARLTFSPKVFIPLTMLCRDRCGYCTFAKPPAHLEAPYLLARRSARHRPPRRRLRLPRGAVHARRGARRPLPGRGRLARRARLLLDRRLPRRRLRGGARGDRPAPPRQRRRALAGGSGAAAGGVAVAGNDDRDAGGAPRGAGRPALGCAGQDARAPAGHARGGGTRRHPLHHRHPRGHRRDACRAARRAARDPRLARAPRPRAGGDRPELPAQARHRHVAPRGVRPRRVPVDHRRGAHRARRGRCTSRRRRTCPTPTSSARWSPPASTTGAACRRSRPTT